MKEKELILILSYCNTKEKKKTLFEFLESLQNFRDKYDILVTSHTPLDIVFFDYFDYYFFDKNNEILTDIEYRQNAWFLPFDNYVIWSSYIEIGSTIGAIWDMLIPSLSISNILKYEKIHYFEYDSEVIHVDELGDNSKLLNNYDYVVYNSNDTHKLHGSFLSFRTDGIIDEWKNYNKSILKDLFFDTYPKVPENIIYNLIKSQKKIYEKDYHKLESSGIKVGKRRGNPVDWNVPFYDPRDNKLKFLIRNITEESYNIKIIINNNLINVGNIKPNTWRIIDLMNNFYETDNLIVFKNDIKTLELDFKSDEFKNKFIYYNSVLDNSSIGIK